MSGESASTRAVDASRAGIPLRSVHHDVFYMPTKMSAAQKLVLPAGAAHG